MKICKKKIVLILLGILTIFVIGSIWYVNDYYHSDNGVEQYLQGSETVSVKTTKDGLLFDGPGEQEALIFYPGAKVEYTAYAPLMSMVAEEGIDCFLVQMPCNLAIFGLNKAEDVQKNYEYDSWYIGGHSLGGAMAASYSAGHLNELDGLLLLAAYPTKTLKQEGFKVLSLYGSEDQVLSMEKVEDGRQYMPEDYVEICIEGGNHAGFGMYGSQDGDGTAAISQEEQWQQTVDAIGEFVDI